MAAVSNQPNTSSKADVYTQSKMLACRFENKYIVSESRARKIYEFVRCYLEPDQFTPEGLTHGYPVHSLYLDSADLHTCNATLQGHKNRFKLRVRFYDEDESRPVFFEIKRRDGVVILKQRALVHRCYVDELLSGASPIREYLYRNDVKNWKALFEFCRLRDLLEARPAAYTSYLRAGYEPSGNNNVRVTFDRQIRAGRFTGKLSALNVELWPMVAVPGVVLELKFTDRFPNWMHELTQLFDLKRGSMPKYVECVTLLKDL
jgi:hypothetical protein